MRPVQVARIGLLLFAAAAALTLAGARTIAVSAQQPVAQPTPGVNPAAPQPTPAAQPGNAQAASPSNPQPAGGPRVIKVQGNIEADDLIKVDVENLA